MLQCKKRACIRASIKHIQVAENKCAKISNKAEVRELAASNWISTTCRDIQSAIIKTCAYNNRFALKCAFGESYNDLYRGTAHHVIIDIINKYIIPRLFIFLSLLHDNFSTPQRIQCDRILT